MQRIRVAALRRHVVVSWLVVGAAAALWMPLRVDDPRFGWSLAWWLLGAPLLMLMVLDARRTDAGEHGCADHGHASRLPVHGPFVRHAYESIERAASRRGSREMAHRRRRHPARIGASAGGRMARR